MKGTSRVNDVPNCVEIIKSNDSIFQSKHPRDNLLKIVAVFIFTILFLSVCVSICYYFFTQKGICQSKLLDSIDVNNVNNDFKVGTKRSIIRNERSTKVVDVCRTDSCILTARNLLANVDFKADPCNNFYQFACGGFLKNTLLSENDMSVSTFTKLNQIVEQRVRAIVEEPISAQDLEPDKKMKMFFEACINADKKSKTGLKSLINHVEQMGGWPFVKGTTWKQENFNITDFVSRARNIGYNSNSLFQVALSPDYRNNSNLCIYLLKPFLMYCKEEDCSFKKSKEFLTYYKKAIYNVAIAMGAHPSLSLFRDIKHMIALEEQIAHVASIQENLSSKKLFHILTVNRLNEIFPYISWSTYFNKLIIPSEPITQEDIVISTIPDYLISLQRILEKTPKRVLANFMIWHLVVDSLEHISQQIPMFNEFVLKYSNKPQLISPKIECFILTKNVFNLVISASYVKRYFQMENKYQVERIVQDIRDRLLNATQQTDWMDGNTKSLAEEKIKYIENFVAYPSELLNDTKLTNLYRKLVVNENEYYNSVLNISKFHQDYLGSKYHKPLSRHHWVSYATSIIVNAFYYPATNTINFPASLIQYPLFAAGRPNYVNYGMLGFIIAHEISHSIYEPGKDFDKFGNFKPWWDSYTKFHFDGKSKCLINQYKHFIDYDTETRLNSTTTLAENFADNSGAELSYAAYKMWKDQHKSKADRALLPGFETYSQDQLFWISFANAWCSKEQLQYRNYLMTKAEHAPSKFRIIGTLSNQEAFSRAFHCPVGSAMNPNVKCKIW